MPRSISFFQSERSTTSATGFMTTTTRTTTTTTTTTTIRRHPRSATSNSFYNMQLAGGSPLAAAAAAATTSKNHHDPSAALFLKAMLEEPHYAEFYANIWSDEEHEKRKKRGRRTRRFTGPLVDIAQVAHVVTTVRDFKSDYAPVPHVDLFNIWTDRDRAFLRDHELPVVASTSSRADGFDEQDGVDDDEDAIGGGGGAYDFMHASGVPYSMRSNAVRGQVRSDLPRRISEASDEGSVDLYVSVPPTAAGGGFNTYAPVMGGRMTMTTTTTTTERTSARHSDPLEDSFADSDASASTVRMSEAAAAPSAGGDRELKRSNTPLVMGPDPDARIKSMLLPSVDSAVPPPSNNGDGSVVFSVVFMEEHEWSWSIKFLLGIHEPIRHALFVMDRSLEQMFRQQQMTVLENHVLEFFTWFKTYFVEYLKCQYELKMNVLHPLIMVRYSTKMEVIKTYEEIYQFVAQIQDQQRQLTSSVGVKDPSTWLARLEALQKAIRKLNLTLHSVLNLEEKMLHAALSSTFTEKTFHQYVMPRVFRSIKAKRVVVPWILERSKVWGGEAEQQSIQGMLPFSAKFLYRKIWRPYFMANVASAMKNLNEFVDNSSALIPAAGNRNSDGGVCSIQ